MKKYWYIFFSFPIYFLLIGDSQCKILKLRKKIGATSFRSIWKSCLGNIFLTWGGVVMFSSILFSSIVPYNITVGGISVVIFWIYFTSIIATYLHVCWREKNIKHLIENIKD